ncbi:hypothetical protein BKA56DRAFT_144794 [Ilyonectria sp. MPI-CAGE-AT-0026]|nr:hypothetical protein BKA56DRAFT_144794 [Ilyonectria sp. MPI-CAGE-AT-0026]
MPTQRFPTEILLMVVESLVPRNSDEIYPPYHPVTKSLVAFTRVCRATNPPASKLLWQFCLYINSKTRAASFAASLKSTPLEKIFSTHLPARLFLRPFRSESERGRARPLPVDAIEPDQETSPRSSSTSSASLPTHTYLSVSPLEDVPTAIIVRDILFTLAPILRSLVIDMPLRTLYPYYDKGGVRPILRDAFEALVNLEDFVSIRDELFLAIDDEQDEPEVWAECWPKLRRLALYNPNMDMGGDIWVDMARLPHLELGIFARADMHGIDGFTVKHEWVNAVLGTRKRARLDLDPQRDPRAISLVFLEDFYSSVDFSDSAYTPEALDPNHCVDIRVLKVPEEESHMTSYGEPNPIASCQSWLKARAAKGTLWAEALAGRR